MMLGRDESMPNVVREPDLPSELRERLREFAAIVTGIPDGISGRRMVLNAALGAYAVTVADIARAIRRYVPAGLPETAPTAIASADDQTRRASVADLPAGVICEPLEDVSSGVVEPSDDGEGTRPVGDLGLTRAIQIDDDTRR